MPRTTRSSSQIYPQQGSQNFTNGSNLKSNHQKKKASRLYTQPLPQSLNTQYVLTSLFEKKKVGKFKQKLGGKEDPLKVYQKKERLNSSERNFKLDNREVIVQHRGERVIYWCQQKGNQRQISRQALIKDNHLFSKMLKQYGQLLSPNYSDHSCLNEDNFNGKWVKKQKLN